MARNATQILKDLYKGEKSAAETYERALKKVGAEEGNSELQAMQRDHAEALESLRQHLSLKGEDLPSGTGAWGSWAKVVMEAASLLGSKSALKALREGEEHGLKQYTAALDDPIDPAIKTMIREKYIPRQEQHIREINQLLQRIS